MKSLPKSYFLFVLLIIFVHAEKHIRLQLDWDPLGEYYQSNTKFTELFYKMMLQRLDSNFFVSPSSIQAILALAAISIEGRPRSDLLKATFLPSDMNKLGDIYDRINEKILYDNSKITTVFSIYTHNVSIATEYKSYIEHQFHAKFRSDHYRGSKSFLTNTDLEFSNGAVLRHEIPFTERWTTQFDRITGSLNFNMTIHDIELVNMVHTTDKLNYYHDEILQVEFVEIPIVDEELILTVALPIERDRLHEVEKNMIYCLCTKPYKVLNVSLIMPEHWGWEFIDLPETMKSMSASFPLFPNSNFKLFSSPKDLKIRQGSQYMSLNQKLAIPAEQTLPMGHGSLIPDKYVTLDHPFMYYIKHSVMGVVAIGRFVKPSEGEILGILPHP